MLLDMIITILSLVDFAVIHYILAKLHNQNNLSKYSKATFEIEMQKVQWTNFRFNVDANENSGKIGVIVNSMQFVKNIIQYQIP